jgi:tetratricopeptide (TPR) repeat protein
MREFRGFLTPAGAPGKSAYDPAFHILDQNLKARPPNCRQIIFSKIKLFFWIVWLAIFSSNALACGSVPDPEYDHSGYTNWCKCIGGEIYTASYGGPACRISGADPPLLMIHSNDPSINSDSPSTQAFLRAYDLHEVGEENAAIAAYRKAIKFNYKYAAAYNNLGLIYKDWGQYQRAIGLYRKAIKYAENSEVRARARGNLRAVLLEQSYCYSRESKPAKAEAGFQSVLAIYSGDAEATLGLKRIHAKDADGELPRYPKKHYQCPTKSERR